MFEQGRVLESQVSFLEISEIQCDMGPQLNYSCARSDRMFPGFPGHLVIWSKEKVFPKTVESAPVLFAFCGEVESNRDSQFS